MNRHPHRSVSVASGPKSHSKRKFIEVVSKNSPSKSHKGYDNSLRYSVVSMPSPNYCGQTANNQNHTHMRHSSFGHAQQNCMSLSRKSSYTNISNKSLGNKIIVKQTIKVLPVHFSYKNPNKVTTNAHNLNKNQQKHQKVPKFQDHFLTPTKKQIIMWQPAHIKPLGIVNQSMQNYHRNSLSRQSYKPPEQIKKMQIIAPSRFSLGSQPTSHTYKRQSIMIRNQQNPHKIDPKQFLNKESRINRQFGAKEINQPNKTKKLLSNQAYMNTTEKQTQFELVNSKVNQPNEIDPQMDQSKVSKYDSLTITKQDRTKNLKQNLDIGKNCLCAKILQFTRCEDIKIHKQDRNKRQVLQPKKNIVY